MKLLNKVVQIAQWDTEHFAIKVGDLILDKAPTISEFTDLLSDARSEGYELLYLKGTTLPDSFLNESVLLADEKVLYSRIIRDENYKENSHISSYLHHNLDVDLLSLALQSGGHSRYYNDKRLSVSVYLTLYKEWILNSLNGKIATDVLVYKEGDRILGFLTYQEVENDINIGLVGVDAMSKRMGIGTKLMSTLFSMCKTNTKVNVVTQKSNIEACRYYEKNGFAIESITNVYHIWVK